MKARVESDATGNEERYEISFRVSILAIGLLTIGAYI